MKNLLFGLILICCIPVYSQKTLYMGIMSGMSQEDLNSYISGNENRWYIKDNKTFTKIHGEEYSLSAFFSQSKLYSIIFTATTEYTEQTSLELDNIMKKLCDDISGKYELVVRDDYTKFYDLPLNKIISYAIWTKEEILITLSILAHMENLTKKYLLCLTISDIKFEKKND